MGTTTDGNSDNGNNDMDYAADLREWRPLAEQGNAFAQTEMGMIYHYGRGVPQDDKTAAKWLLLAAIQGNADAQYLPGAMYYDGSGIPQDFEAALKWYTLATNQGA